MVAATRSSVRRRRDVGNAVAASGCDDAEIAKGEIEDRGKLLPVQWKTLLRIAAALVVFGGIAETISPTAYGRFGGKGFPIDPRLGWWLMEAPCTFVFIYSFWIRGGSQSKSLVPRILAVVFCGHYLYRGWIFPLSIRVYGNTKNFSLPTAIMAWIVTTVHAELNARWYGSRGKHLNNAWLRSARFWIGLALYYSGLAMLVWHDNIMRNLRPCPNGARYCIPHGGLFDYATAAHYFVELWTWTGFAILSWGPNGLFILCMSLANLVTRAYRTHMWYEDKFGAAYTDLDRKNLIPFVW